MNRIFMFYNFDQNKLRAGVNSLVQNSKPFIKID